MKRIETMKIQMDDVDQQRQQMVTRTDETVESVEIVSSATAELSASIASISLHANETARFAAAANRTCQQTNAAINTLDSRIKSIGDILSLIHKSAAQTDLLALNATIEASRSVSKSLTSVAAQTADAGRTTGQVLSDGLALDKLFASLNGQIDAFIQTLTGDRPNAVESLE